MDRNEAEVALAEVQQARRKLAERAQWPFHRHAMFGLMEGLLVAGVAQPIPLMAGMITVSMALLTLCVTEDRRRHGMFVSGWQAGATRPLMIKLTLFLVTMVMASLFVRNGDSAAPLGYALGALTFAVSTAASLRWEIIYRRELLGRSGQ